MRVRDNKVADSTYSGLWVGWGCRQHVDDLAEISGNQVFDVMKTMVDGGGIYTCGGQGRITGNQVNHRGRRTPGASSSIQHNPTPGIYIDNHSQYFNVTNNAAPSFLRKSRTVRVVGSGADVLQNESRLQQEYYRSLTPICRPALENLKYAECLERKSARGCRRVPKTVPGPFPDPNWWP